MLRRLLRGAVQAAQQGSAFNSSTSTVESILQHQLGRSCSAATSDGLPIAVSSTSWRQQSCGYSFAAPRNLTHVSEGMASSSGRACSDAAQGVSALRLPWSLSHTPRGLFGAAKPVVNPQIHTHDKYKKENPQPANSFLLGRFVTDRNGVIWHRQANYRHARHAKSASQLTRLKRWKPLAPAFAAKLRKLGFAERYWAAPDPQDVPGFHSPSGRVERPRRSAVPDLNHTTGEPALRQSWQPPNRQRLR